MKKIIATVLAMVMALALCTVAFADTQTIDKDKVSAVDAAGAAYDFGTITSVEKTLASKSTSGTSESIVPAYYTITSSANGGIYVECDKSLATCLLTIKGGESVYVVKMGAAPAAFSTKAATLYTAPKKATCDKVGANEDTYVVVDGSYYLAADASSVDTAAGYALVNGKMVAYVGNAVPAQKHNFDVTPDKATVTYNTDGTVATVKCAVCEKAIPVVATPGKFDGKTYVKIENVTNTQVAWNHMYYVAGTVANGTTTNNTNTSPKTFDAGIAMYVGMALTSVAGSAVVIGKKKEF